MSHLPPQESWRAFIAIELPAPVRRRIKIHIDYLREALPGVRAGWVREENLHLTLKFFGDLPLEKVDALLQALERAAARINSFELEIAGCGSFPLRGKPKVLWIGVSEPGQTSSLLLNQAIEDECGQAGFPRDARTFHPHLTIARFRNPDNARRLAELHRETVFEPVSLKVEDICLVRSELSSEGSRYTVTSRHKLGSAA